MRSLFAKILGWFVLTLVTTLAASMLINILTYDPYSKRAAPFSMMLSVEMIEAVHAFETGGREALHDALERFRAVNHAQETILTDPSGVDLVSGEPHPDLLKEARNWSSFPFSGRGGTTFARFSADGRYCYFLITEPQYLFFSNLRPAHLLVLVLAVMCCVTRSLIT